MGNRLVSGLCLLLVLFAGAAQPTENDAVLMVLSNGDPYLQMAEEARAVLETADLSVATVRLNSAELESELEEHRQVIAVGSRAVRRVQDSDWAGTLVFLAYDPGAIGLPGPGDSAAQATGLALQVPVAEQLRKLKELLPEVRRIGVLYDPLKTQERVDRARRTASDLELQLVPIAVRVPGELMDQARLLAPQVDALWALDQSVMTQSAQRALTLFALRARLPLLAISKSYVDRGALAAVVPDLEALGHRAGEMMLEISQGAPPSSIAVESPPRCVLEVNSATLGRLGIELESDLQQTGGGNR